MGDQTILCDLALICAVIDAVDAACQDRMSGGIRSRLKTHAIIYASAEPYQAHHET